MKPVLEIKIKDLLGDSSKYKTTWLGKEVGLDSGIKDKKIAQAKKEFFEKMKVRIDKLKGFELAEKKIKIYKKERF
jgi:hypothetical protein